uniref:C1q domain-containing protein n=1 Tax=Lynx canadensis TaxID=61383 RepID=A0A667HI10_LYNCA
MCKMRAQALQLAVHLLSLQPTAQGAFLRGSGLSLASGRFTAPVTAIFQFSASLHVGEWGRPPGPGPLLQPHLPGGLAQGHPPPALSRSRAYIWQCVLKAPSPSPPLLSAPSSLRAVAGQALSPQTTGSRRAGHGCGLGTQCGRSSALSPCVIDTCEWAFLGGTLNAGRSRGVVPQCRPHCVWGWGPGPAVSCALTPVLRALSRSLEAISGLESRGRVFTMQVQGLLHLQAGQYASIFVDNGSGTALTIQSGSSFSGLLLGT